MIKLNTLTQPQLNNLVMAILSLILFSILISPYSDSVDQYFSQHQLMQSNNQYLMGLEKKDRHDLLLLAGIDGFLSLIESSQLGVSFIVDAQIQVGSIISPLMDVTKNSFESTLTSLLLTIGMQKLLSFVEWIAPYFAKVFLFLMSVYYLLRVKGPDSNRLRVHVAAITKYTAIIFLTLHLLIPYSVHLAAQVDQYLYQSVRLDVSNDLKNLHHELVNKNDTNNVKEKAENTIKNLERMLLDIPAKTEALFSYYASKVIFCFFSMILLPALTFLTLALLAVFYFRRYILN